MRRLKIVACVAVALMVSGLKGLPAMPILVASRGPSGSEHASDGGRTPLVAMSGRRPECGLAAL